MSDDHHPGDFSKSKCCSKDKTRDLSAFVSSLSPMMRQWKRLQEAVLAAVIVRRCFLSGAIGWRWQQTQDSQYLHSCDNANL
jgi:hypothetical protein